MSNSGAQALLLNYSNVLIAAHPHAARYVKNQRGQREHPAIDARERAAQAAVVGIEYGGGFRHDLRAASTACRATIAVPRLSA